MSEDFEVTEGHCTCGQTRFQMTRAPLFVHCCHCTWCQRESGSAFALNALVETEAVELLAGEVESVETPTNSGKGQLVMRCSQCRVALWSHYSGAGNALCFVRVGCLDQAHRFAPDVHIFTESKLPWVVLPPDTPAVMQYYRASELWPAASLARRAALLTASV